MRVCACVYICNIIVYAPPIPIFQHGSKFVWCMSFLKPHFSHFIFRFTRPCPHKFGIAILPSASSISMLNCTEKGPKKFIQVLFSQFTN